MSQPEVFDAVIDGESLQVPLVDARAVKRAPVSARSTSWMLQRIPFELYLTEVSDYTKTPADTFYYAHALVSAIGQRRMKEGMVMRIDVPEDTLASAKDRVQAASIAVFTISAQLKQLTHQLWSGVLPPQVMAMFP